MIIIFTILILFTFNQEISSQVDTTESRNKLRWFNFKDFNYNTYKNIPDSLLARLREKGNNLESDNHRVEIIPIPPATKENSVFELIPLYKPGGIIVRYLNKRAE